MDITQTHNSHWTEELERIGFWFVDIPRTSSSSIRAELGKEFGALHGKSNLLEKEFSTSQVVKDHMPAKMMLEAIGRDLWQKLFTFSFVRNPWDRVLSMYFYRIRKKHFTEDFKFKDYVLELERHLTRHRSDLFLYHGHYFSNSDYILDQDNKPLVTFIGKYENREHDIENIKKEIGVKTIGELWIQASSPESRHYSRYYDDDTKNIVNKLYSNDIQMFGYQFDEDG